MDSLPAHSTRLWTVGAGGSQARYARAPIRNLTTGPSLFLIFWVWGGSLRSTLRWHEAWKTALPTGGPSGGKIEPPPCGQPFGCGSFPPLQQGSLDH